VRLSQQPPSNGLLWEATVKLRREHSLGARALFHQTSNNAGSNMGGNGNAANAMFSPMSTGRHPSVTGGVSSSNGSKAGANFYPTIPGVPSPAGQMQQQQPQPMTPSQQPSAPAMDQVHDAAVGDITSLETVFRSGIARPEDLPAVVSAAQACLLSNSRGLGDHSRRGTLHTTNSFGQGAPGSPAAAAEAALRTADAGQHTGLKFSRDVVIVEVSGAPVDLTLIDLPGEAHISQQPLSLL
jgi:hypothetical protein